MAHHNHSHGDSNHNHHDDHHHEKNHPYHIIELSPLPALTSFALLFMAISLVAFMKGKEDGQLLLAAGIVAVLTCMTFWFKKIVFEGIVDKAHNTVVQRGLRIGMALFIASEVMFFFGFFFSYFATFFKAIWFDAVAYDFDNLFNSTKDLPWPPEGIKTFNPFELPFLNTLILLLSGTTCTWAHYELLNNNRKGLIQALSITVGLGILFTLCQAFEYSHAAFKISDNNYSSNFYMATGFHGFHVIVGTIFLAVNLFRAIKSEKHLTVENHLGFEFAAWYWHFVDVVWLFLFVAIYWWGK